MDDFLILLQAKLDEAKSKGNVNADIEKLQSQLDKLKIQATIDSKSIFNLTNQMSKLGIQIGQDFGKSFNSGLSSTINSNVLSQINKISDSSTSTIIQNEKKKQEAYKATSDTVVYHAGVISKLNKAETNGRFYGSNRGTGYFGTGHYFVDSKTKHELDNNSSYSKLPYTSVDISKYDNLFKATTDEVAGKLHSFLENLTKFTQGSDRFNIEELFSQFKNVFTDTTMDIKSFGDKMEELKTYMSNSSLDDRRDSVSTQFMKSLGYSGVDTRGTKYADTRYGTVIYDLKEESVLQANITDELQKQGQMLEKINYEKGQVFDSSADAKIQAQIDAQNRMAEVKAEFHKLFNDTNLNNSGNELTSAQNRLSEINDIILNCQHSIENATAESQQFAKEMKSLGLNMTDSEIAEHAKESSLSYRQRIEELSLERAELEKKIPILEETYNKESQLASEAYKQAEQIVEQRRQEAQQIESTTNAVVQGEGKKQQAIQENIKLYSELASFNEKFKDTGIATINNDGIVDMKKSLEEVRNIYSDFGKVTIKNEMSDLATGAEQFRVNIESSNGELKRTESFLMKLSEDGKSFVFVDDKIKSSENVVRHLNEQKDATDKVILEEEKLANQMADVREKSEQIRQAEERRQQLAQNSAINKELEKEYNQRLKIEEATKAQVDKIQLSIETGGYESKVESLISKTQQWTDLNGNARISTTALSTALNNLENASKVLSNNNTVKNQKALISAEKELDTQIKKVTNSIRTMNAETMKSSAIDSLRQKYQEFYDKNGAAHRKWGTQLKQAMLELASGATISKQRGEELKQELIQIQNAARQAGKLGKSGLQKIFEGFKSFGYWTSSTFIFMKAFQSIKSGLGTVKALDTALVDLKKTTTMTNSELEDFYYSSNKVAKQMGVTTEEIISQAAEFSRLGYSSKEAATQMAKYSSWFKTISPGMSIEQAGDTLTSVMKAFKYDVQDVEKIMSMINTVGNNFAVSNLDISEILTRSSSAMMEANNNLADTIALGTAA